MEERGVEIDHSTVNRWVLKYVPLLEQAFHRRKRPVGVSWRLDVPPAVIETPGWSLSGEGRRLKLILPEAVGVMKPCRSISQVAL